MTPAQEFIIFFPRAMGHGNLYEKRDGLTLERPLEKHENIIEVTREVQNAADWIGMRVAGYTSKYAGTINNIRPHVSYRLEPWPNEGTGWLAIPRTHMEWAHNLAMEIGELQNSLSDDGPDRDTEDLLNMKCQELGEVMADFLMTWRA